MPKKGESQGLLVWLAIDESELSELDRRIAEHNSILSRVKRRSIKAVSRSEFLRDLVVDSLINRAMPTDRWLAPGSARVKARLPVSVLEDLEAWLRMVNSVRNRGDQEPIARQHLLGSMVRMYLVRVRQEETPGEIPESRPAPILMPMPVMTAAEPLMRESLRNQIAWNRMLQEEWDRRRFAAEWETMADDEWARFFARHTVWRDILGTFVLPRGQNPNPLKRAGLVGWLAPRLRVAGWRGR